MTAGKKKDICTSGLDQVRMENKGCKSRTVQPKSGCMTTLPWHRGLPCVRLQGPSKFFNKKELKSSHGRPPGPAPWHRGLPCVRLQGPSKFFNKKELKSSHGRPPGPAPGDGCPLPLLRHWKGASYCCNADRGSYNQWRSEPIKRRASYSCNADRDIDVRRVTS